MPGTWESIRHLGQQRWFANGSVTLPVSDCFLPIYGQKTVTDWFFWEPSLTGSVTASRQSMLVFSYLWLFFFTLKKKNSAVHILPSGQYGSTLKKVNATRKSLFFYKLHLYWISVQNSVLNVSDPLLNQSVTENGVLPLFKTSRLQAPMIKSPLSPPAVTAVTADGDGLYPMFKEWRLEMHLYK